MIGKVLNLPFKVLGGVARAVQAQDAKKRTQHQENESTQTKTLHEMSLDVPDDFNAGSISMSPDDAVSLLETGCIVDATSKGANIPNALHIPAREFGIRIAELPPETTIIVIAEDTASSDQIVRFLRHRGLDETWSLDGGLRSWKKAGGPVGDTSP